MAEARLLLQQARALLAETESPQLDARLLLQAASGLSHVALVADPDVRVSDEVAVHFMALVERRARHEPVSRILGEREFYGRGFAVTPAVLDPRPDTEVLVEAVLALIPADQNTMVLDLGTGSGILAVTLLAERELARADAVDVSSEALEVALGNAVMLGVSARFRCLQGSWFGPVTGRYDAIVSNPPYICAADVSGLEDEVKLYDPHLALVGGADGLECYRQIAGGSAVHLRPAGFVAVEIGAGQALDVGEIFNDSGFRLESQHPDLGGHIRVLVFRRSGKGT